MNWNELQDFFEARLLGENIPGVGSSNLARPNLEFDADSAALWVECRVVETSTRSRTARTTVARGAAVYTIATKPNSGAENIEFVARRIRALFSPVDARRGVFFGPYGDRIVVRRVEGSPAILVDARYQKNVRVVFDAIYAERE